MGELMKTENWIAEIKNGDFAQIIKEEMGDLGGITFEEVKVPSGGGLAFEVEGDEEPEMVKTLSGVIIHHHATNAYWSSDYTGENAEPDCLSTDGEIGVDRFTGEIRDCRKCEYNQYGSSGNGKACKNMQRIYFLREGEYFPIRITLPPTSIKALKNYIGSKKVVLSGKRSWQVLTEIKLQKAQSSGGITYSQCVFSKIRNLEAEEALVMQNMHESIKEQAKASNPHLGMIDVEISDDEVPFN